MPPLLLVAGSSGRIGRRLARVWDEAPRAARPLFASRAGMDLAWDPLEGPGALARARADAMLLLSGVTDPEGPLARNTDLALAAAEACRALGIPRLLVASSSAVYGAGLGRPMGEGDPVRPASGYGTAKLLMEQALEEAEGPEICCLRIGNVAGADMLLRSALEARPERPLRLDRFENGRGPRRSYIGPSGLAHVAAVLAAHDGPLPDLLNVAAPGPVYMGELLEAAEVPYRYRPAPPGALQEITLDTSALEAICPLPVADPHDLVAQWRRSGEAA